MESPVILVVLGSTYEDNLTYSRIIERYSLCQRTENIDNTILDELLCGKYTGLILDCKSPVMASQITVQALLGISNIVPSIYFNVGPLLRKLNVNARPVKAHFCLDASIESIFEHFEALSSRNTVHVVPNAHVIPHFDRNYAADCLGTTSALSLLAIDARNLKVIEARFGKQAFDDARKFFQGLLVSLWGTSGSFRSKDTLCQSNESSNVYYVILEPSRTIGQLPPPGVLETVADRVQIQIENAMRRSITAAKGTLGLPHGMTAIPDVHVGYASATASFIEDNLAVVDQLTAEALKTAKLQERRMNIRRKEYMQTLICTPEALTPVYQAVFRLDGLTYEMVERATAGEGIKALSPAIYGFESLIRAQKNVIAELLGSSLLTSIDPGLLMPDVVFSLAKSVNTALELDLVAMRQAVRFAEGLPGKLMINILPRNFYNLTKIQKFLPENRDLVFEVSESEAIENFDLVCEVRAALKLMNIGVATDDFGKDYGGLERIFKIQPDIIKLDRALIADIHLDAPRKAFLAGLVQSASMGNAVTLAEGVEKWEEAAVLQKIGVNLIQGYLLHRPQESSVIQESLQAEHEQAQSGAKIIPLKAS